MVSFFQNDRVCAASVDKLLASQYISASSSSFQFNSVLYSYFNSRLIGILTECSSLMRMSTLFRDTLLYFNDNVVLKANILLDVNINDGNKSPTKEIYSQ